MTQIWCGIPVFNNAATIAEVARRCREQIEHVIIVDDGSTDADLRELLKPLDVAVVRHPTNLGKGVALLTAFRYAAEHGAEYLITLDGDGQHFPEDIPNFLPRLAPDAILIGSREKIIGNMPGSSHFGRDFSDFWICIECRRRCSATRKADFAPIPSSPPSISNWASRHYNLEMEIITRAVWAGLAVQSVPIRVEYLDAAKRVSQLSSILRQPENFSAPHATGLAGASADSAPTNRRQFQFARQNPRPMAQAVVDAKFQPARPRRRSRPERIIEHRCCGPGARSPCYTSPCVFISTKSWCSQVYSSASSRHSPNFA